MQSMQSQKFLRGARALAMAALCAAPAVSVAEGTDDLWEITTKMEMQGMPMAMPAQTNKVCQPKDRPQEESAVPADKNCKMSDMQRSGNKSSFKVVCTGKDSFTGTGNFEHNGDNYKGTIQMQGRMEGENFSMTQNISGKRIGSCTYKDIGKEMVAKQEAATADICRQSIERLEWVTYKDDMVAACKPYKKDFCARVNKTAADMHTAAGFRKVADKRQDWENILGTCGVATQPVLTDACRDGKDTKNWDFIIQYCPVEGKAIAQEQCAGRDYTAVMSGPYAALCRKYAADTLQSESKTAQPANAVDAAKEGVKSSLKKLLPF
jgi:Protein of unknown function (DUF3617)